MSDQTPQELDDLFRQGAGEHHFTYNPEAWADMEVLLDRDKRRRRAFWWWLLGIGLGILIVIITLTVNWSVNDPSLESQVSEATQSHKVEDQSAVEGQRNTTFTDINNTSKIVNTASEKKPHLKASKTADTDVFNKQYQEKQHESTKPKAPVPQAFIPKKPLETKQAISKTNTPLIAGINGTEPSDTLSEQSPMAAIDFQKKSEFSSIATLTLLPAFESAPPSLSLPSDTSYYRSKALPTTKNHLVINAVYGYSSSFADTSLVNKLDWKAGMELEYRYAGKYSFGLGGFFTRKKYLGGAGAYAPPRGFWTNGIAPASTSAFCEMLEVPVWLGYYPKGYDRSGFYARAGLTSYFMLKEYYHYYYAEPDPDLIQWWGAKNESRHWFGIGELAVGYQQRIGKWGILQLSPYAHLPINGIGHGKIRLWTVGLNLSLGIQPF